MMTQLWTDGQWQNHCKMSKVHFQSLMEEVTFMLLWNNITCGVPL